MAVVIAVVIFARPGRMRRRVGVALATGLLGAWMAAGSLGVPGMPHPNDPGSIVPRLHRQFAPAIAQLERLTTGEPVAYAGMNLPYYLFGTQLKNTVRYVAVNRCHHCLFHHYVDQARKRPGYRLPDTAKLAYYRQDADYERWIDNLRSDGVRWLFVSSMHPWEQRFYRHDAEGYPIERTWADRHPDRFDLVYMVHWARIYRFRWQPLVGSGG